ncbi:protein kinase superfamily protein [Actinidia rufa]|uniref:Protein kinase superfamily protein n=1 Tax=Actinidia rufa TaxID=165716 RepID=A0A7J0EZK5_9ERIC|nr:protein kinase superfamily protein [Actinidia rufa]
MVIDEKVPKWVLFDFDFQSCAMFLENTVEQLAHHSLLRFISSGMWSGKLFRFRSCFLKCIGKSGFRERGYGPLLARGRLSAESVKK